MLTSTPLPVRVPVPGTPVRILDVAPISDNNHRVHGVMIQVFPGNTGILYVGNGDLNKGTYVGVHAFLAIPTVNFIPTFSAALTIAPNAIDLAKLYLDAAVAQNGAIITYLLA